MTQDCEFDCPECKTKSTTNAADGLFACSGCGGILSMKLGKKVQPLGTIQAIIKAQGAGRLVVVAKG